MYEFLDRYKGAKELYESGLSTNLIAIKYGCTQRNMHRVLRLMGTKFRPAKPPFKERYSGAPAMYESGASIRVCAAYYGIDSAAMWYILKRRGVKMRPKLRYGKDSNLYRGGKTYDGAAIQMVNEMVKRGLIIPQPCEICGLIPTVKNRRRTVEAHHDDYNKPLELRWLCNLHHKLWHRQNKAIPLKLS